MSYKVTFLNDEDFERLPGNNMEGKVGVAYPSMQEAYVRKSGSNLVDVFSAMHELEHLQGSDRGEHFDHENQCYYKDFGQTMQTLAPAFAFIPGIGPIAAAGAGIGGGLMHNNQQNKAMASQQRDDQNRQGGFFSPSISTTQPAISMAQGATGGASGGNAGGNAIKSLSQQPQFGDIENQRYGNISGRSPLMSIFGGE